MNATRRFLVVLFVLLVAPLPTHADESRASAALDKMVKKHARSFLSLGRKWVKKDPDLAERALRTAMDLDPGCTQAGVLLRKMGRGGRLVVLFDGADMGAWHHADEPQWRVEGRELRGNCTDAAYLMRTIDTFENSYIVKMEARYIRANSTSATLFALGGDADDDETRIQMGLLRGLPYFESKSPGEDKDLHKGSLDDVKPRLDIHKWNTYEIEFRGDEVIASINGQELSRGARGDEQEGYISLVVQDCEFAVRRIEVRSYE